MTTALLFPGQGTDLADAVSEWRTASGEVRALLDVASDALGVTAGALARPLTLARTEVAQAVLTALGVGIARAVAAQGVVPRVVAGHSVGELAACAVAGAIDDEAVVRVAALRGRLMAREASRRSGGMLAVRANEPDVASLLASRRADEHLVIAAHNAPDEWVLSGDLAALRRVAARWPGTPLPTPGAWHSPAMADATAEYAHALREVVRETLDVPVIANRTGDVVRDAAELPALLAGQLTHRVRWAASMATLAALDTSRVIVCGPGRALRRFAAVAMPATAILVLPEPGLLADLAPLPLP